MHFRSKNERSFCTAKDPVILFRKNNTILDFVGSRRLVKSLTNDVVKLYALNNLTLLFSS